MAATLVITGWRQGLQKVSMTRALQAHAGLGLAAAKAVTDGVLEGRRMPVSLPSAAHAAALAHQLEALGAACHVEPGAVAG